MDANIKTAGSCVGGPASASARCTPASTALLSGARRLRARRPAVRRPSGRQRQAGGVEPPGGEPGRFSRPSAGTGPGCDLLESRDGVEPSVGGPLASLHRPCRWAIRATRADGARLAPVEAVKPYALSRRPLPCRRRPRSRGSGIGRHDLRPASIAVQRLRSAEVARPPAGRVRAELIRRPSSLRRRRRMPRRSARRRSAQAGGQQRERLIDGEQRGGVTLCGRNPFGKGILDRPVGTRRRVDLVDGGETRSRKAVSDTHKRWPEAGDGST